MKQGHVRGNGDPSQVNKGGSVLRSQHRKGEKVEGKWDGNMSMCTQTRYGKQIRFDSRRPGLQRERGDKPGRRRGEGGGENSGERKTWSI